MRASHNDLNSKIASDELEPIVVAVSDHHIIKVSSTAALALIGHLMYSSQKRNYRRPLKSSNAQ